MNKKLNVAVIGTGYLGQFHAEKYAKHPDVNLFAVCDINLSRAQSIAEKLNTDAVSDYHVLLDQVDAVSIVTPTSTHHSITRDFLNQGVHVLLEKPMTRTIEEADELIEAAQEHDCILQIGHLERFNPVVKELSTILDKPKFIESTRIGPFQARNMDVCVILDLMIHDIDLIQSIIQSPVSHVDAVGVSVLSDHYDIANVRLHFENGCVANATASRASLKKERTLRIFQQNTYVSVDLKDKILSVHQKSKEGQPGILTERQPVEMNVDVLNEEIKAFIQSVNTKTQPLVSGIEGRDVLKTALAIKKVAK